MQSFDVVIIGGGPGGISAGVMLSKAGKSVALVQAEQDSLGGVCLNRGCMPTKSLLKAAKAYRYAKEAEKYGLDILAQPVDLRRLRAVAEVDLDQLRGMLQWLVTDAGIAVFRGQGSFLSAHEVAVTGTDGRTEVLRGGTIVIATGSQPAELPGIPFDGQFVLSSDELLRNTELPARLLIVGGGAIGCEFATLYQTFGSEVIMVEALDRLLPREDAEAGQMLRTALEAQGIVVRTGATIEQLTIAGGQVQVRYHDLDRIDSVDKVLVGIGRKPNLAGLNLEAAGVAVAQGAIKVNAWLQTSIPHIYAVGDVIGGLTLAHAAEQEGQRLAENLLRGTQQPLEQRAVPRVAFCHPEVAAVGIGAAQAGIKTVTLPQVPNGRSVVDKVPPAFVKLFVHEESTALAGAVIIGEAATEMIHELALAVEHRLTVAQVRDTVHAHPTHSKNVLHALQHVH